MGMLIRLPFCEQYGYPLLFRERELVGEGSSQPALQNQNGVDLAPMQGSVPSSPMHTTQRDLGSAGSTSSSSSLDQSLDGSEKEQERTDEITRDALRAYMLTHSLEGHKLMRNRTPFVGEIVNFPSPTDPEVSFGIRRLPNRDVMAYRDKNSVVRFISEEADATRIVQERDYPMGTMRVDTVEMGLATWNIVDENNQPVTISRETILQYLDPDELDAIYEKVHEINPILAGRDARKNS